jgi:hypothetical protein
MVVVDTPHVSDLEEREDDVHSTFARIHTRSYLYTALQQEEEKRTWRAQRHGESTPHSHILNSICGSNVDR